jgi:transposase
MIRRRQGHKLDAWITAVRAGLSLVWSNGPTEGCIHRLKLLKRQA